MLHQDPYHGSVYNDGQHVGVVHHPRAVPHPSADQQEGVIGHVRVVVIPRQLLEALQGLYHQRGKELSCNRSSIGHLRCLCLCVLESLTVTPESVAFLDERLAENLEGKQKTDANTQATADSLHSWLHYIKVRSIHDEHVLP